MVMHYAYKIMNTFGDWLIHSPYIYNAIIYVQSHM